MKEEEYSGKLDLGVWRDIFRHGRRYRKHLAGMISAGLVLAGIDASLPLITRTVFNRLETQGADATLWPLAIAYIVMVGLFASCVFTFITLGGKTSTGVATEIRQAGFDRLQELSFSYYDRRSTGWLVTRLTSDCDRLSRVISWGVLDLVWGSVLIATISVIMLIVNWKLALMVLATLPPLIYLSLKFQKRILGHSRAVRKTNSDITAAYAESINGVRTTKALVRERSNLREFSHTTDRMYASSIRSALWSAGYLPVVLTLSAIGSGLVLWTGGVDAFRGRIPIGDLVLFISYATFFFHPIEEIARMFADLQNAQAAAERVVGLINTEPEIQDAPAVRAALATHAAQELPEDTAPDGGDATIRTLEFRHVDFGYKADQFVLRDFNLTVRAGQTIALAGPTGGGKSTIVSLLCRFYEPTGGQILINGTDYRDRSLHWLQSNLGIVLQKPHLFSGTIAENIRYGHLDATDAEVHWAATVAGADEFIRACSDGYETQVGQDGVKLSAGQKQLLSMARAILADPQIFIMDEATSSIDTEAEQLIQAGVDQILAGRISFVIAHRLSTIRRADRILVIDGGRIVEDGTHRQLLGQGGFYYELYTNQFTREAEQTILEGD